MGSSAGGRMASACHSRWAKVAPALAERHALLLFDFLGFGASEKPAEHEYSLHEQADLVEAMWAREGISSTIVVAHDYAVSVTQELLARRAQGALGRYSEWTPRIAAQPG